jgi:hypothetical protein
MILLGLAQPEPTQSVAPTAKTPKLLAGLKLDNEVVGGVVIAIFPAAKTTSMPTAVRFDIAVRRDVSQVFCELMVHELFMTSGAFAASPAG